MAPCKEMLVVSAMLSGPEGFQENRQAFKELKKLTLGANKIMPRLMPGLSTNGCPRTLLPDRSSCDACITRYCQSWGRIYTILDPAVLAEDIDEIFPLGPEGVVEDSLSLWRIFLVVAIATQDSETNRLVSRRLARYVEDCIHSSKMFRKPCIEVMQLLLLLMAMKTISASDTDDMSNFLGVQSFASQIVLVMSLHRDPAIFPDLSPCEAEMRKRLWACFMRLSLDHSIRSGTQFVLFADEIDCPPPSLMGLQSLRYSHSVPVAEQWKTHSQSKIDAKFSFFTAKLARIIMRLQQTLCSDEPNRVATVQADLRPAFDQFLTDLPPELKPVFPTTCAIQRLMQTLISTTLHSFVLIPGMSAIIGKPCNVSLQGQLTEVWENSISILDQFQSLCQVTDNKSNVNIQTMAHQLLWADVARAALCSCLAVGKMQRSSLTNLISAPMQQTAGIFEQVLSGSLSFLVQFWKSRFYLGPVTSKLALLLAVAMTVTANLRDHRRLNGSGNDDVLKRMGVAVAEEWVNDMREAIVMQQRQAQALTDNTNADFVETGTASLHSGSTVNVFPPSITLNSKDIVSQEIHVLPEDDPAVADPFDVDFSTLDPKLTSEFSHLDSLEFSAGSNLHLLGPSAGDTFDMVGPEPVYEFSQVDLESGNVDLQESIRDILNGLEMAPGVSILNYLLVHLGRAFREALPRL